MASLFSTAFDGGSTFYDQIIALNSRHEMTQKLYYKVYVYSPFVNHHCLVLVDKEEYCEHVTIELTIQSAIDETWQVFPKADTYSGSLQDLVYKGEVYTSLEHFCEVAYRVLMDMGSYDLAFNNCQHFCDKVLKQFGLPGHTTDTTKIGVAGAVVAGIAGVGLAAYSLCKYLSGDKDSDKKERRRKY